MGNSYYLIIYLWDYIIYTVHLTIDFEGVSIDYFRPQCPNFDNCFAVVNLECTCGKKLNNLAPI